MYRNLFLLLKLGGIIGDASSSFGGGGSEGRRKLSKRAHVLRWNRYPRRAGAAWRVVGLAGGGCRGNEPSRAASLKRDGRCGCHAALPALFFLNFVALAQQRYRGARTANLRANRRKRPARTSLMA